MSKKLHLQFESDLDFQKQAINSVVDLFEGTSRTQFTHFDMPSNSKKDDGFLKHHLGLANDIKIPLENVQKVQANNNILPLADLKNWDGLGKLDFCVEMETGTGKTYVYLRTIMELYTKYNISKFVIIVPSVAIREGVIKTLDITKDHFKGLYDTPTTSLIYNYKLYNSNRLGYIRNFANSNTLEILVMNIDSFNKDKNIFNNFNDKLGCKPADLLKETNPVVIIDEPQSVVGKKTIKKENISRKSITNQINPSLILRYSATHIEKEQLLYKLTPVDAYNKGLVKQISVLSVTQEESHNSSYIKLTNITSNKTTLDAKLKLDCFNKNTITRKELKVKKGTDLEDITKREVYKGFIIDEINKEHGYITFNNKEEKLYLGSSWGISLEAEQEQQIRETILEHLRKQKQLKKHNIKVLSLFFIDKVSNYRYYDEDKNAIKGKFAKMFEKNLIDILSGKEFNNLFEHQSQQDIKDYAKNCHEGYFSLDGKSGGFKDSKTGKSNDDISAYEKIMKKKRRTIKFY